MAPLALLTAVIPLLSVRSSRETCPEKTAAHAVLATVIPTLIVWFLIAPDPRFALAPMWLFRSCSSRGSGRSRHPPSSRSLLIGVGAVAVVFLLLVREIRWLVFANFDVWAGATFAMWVLVPSRSRNSIAYAATFTALAVPLQIIATHGAFHVVVSNHQGRFGTPVLPTPPLSQFRTASGLVLFKPRTLGSDQCWAVLLCTPQPNPQLRLRGSHISSGFTVRPSN